MGHNWISMDISVGITISPFLAGIDTGIANHQNRIDESKLHDAGCDLRYLCIGVRPCVACEGNTLKLVGRVGAPASLKRIEYDGSESKNLWINNSTSARGKLAKCDP
jgi:hypothetical protein